LGISAYASGGSYGGGMALVGEQGPELIDFNTGGQVYNASQSANIIGGEVAGEIRALREEVSLLRYEARSTAISSAKIARLQDNWDVRGLTVKTDIDQPLDTVAV
jgi:phage-related tail protein